MHPVSNQQRTYEETLNWTCHSGFVMSTDGGSTVRHAYPLLVCSQNQLGDSERQDLSLITAALGSSNLAQLSQWCCWKFPSLSFTCCFNTMSLTAAQQIFKQTSVEEELDVLQQDIAGFDNQVSHDRIVLVYSMSFQVFSKNNDVHKTK